MNVVVNASLSTSLCPLFVCILMCVCVCFLENASFSMRFVFCASFFGSSSVQICSSQCIIIIDVIIVWVEMSPSIVVLLESRQLKLINIFRQHYAQIYHQLTVRPTTLPLIIVYGVITDWFTASNPSKQTLPIGDSYRLRATGNRFFSIYSIFMRLSGLNQWANGDVLLFVADNKLITSRWW